MQYDAIVIGSGLGGLTAAAVYARFGYRVLVLERNHDFGGAATVYTRGDLAIEASLHETTDPHHPRDPNHKLFKLLGMLDDLQFVPIPDFYEVRCSLFDQPFVLPHGMDKAKHALQTRFPNHKKALNRFFEHIEKTLTFVGLFDENHNGLWWLSHTPQLLVRFWPVLRSMKKSLAQVFEQYFGDDEAIKFALAANLAYYAADSRKMWWFFYALAQGGYLAIGGYYIKGGSKTLVNRLLHAIDKAGGKAMASRRVTRILLDEHGHACGVEHEASKGGDVQTAVSNTVFGNAAPHMLVMMLPAEKQTAFMQSYADKPVSLSLFTISLGLNQRAATFGVTNYSTVLLPDWMQRLVDYRDSAVLMSQAPGEKLPGMVIVDYSRIDSGLNEQPPYLLSIVGLDRLENWSSLSQAEYHARRDQWLEAIIARLDQEYPGIAGAITQKEMTTALSMQRYLNTPGGALYGFAPEPPAQFSFREPPRTPQTTVEGLWLASSYAGAGGFTGAMLSGAIAARMAMKTAK